MYVFLKGTTRLTAVVSEENQLIKLNFFWVIAGEAFPDVVGQVEIDLPVCASTYRTFFDIHFAAAGAYTAATIDDAFHIQPLFEIQLGQ